MLVYVPCDYAIHAPPLVHIAAPVVHHVKHHAKHAAGHHGARVALARRMCPVWDGVGLTDALADEGRDGGWLNEPAEFAEMDNDSVLLGGYSGESTEWGLESSIPNRVDRLADRLPPTVDITTTPDTPPDSPPFIPPYVPPDTAATPVPESSTWVMILVGFTTLIGIRWRRT